MSFPFQDVYWNETADFIRASIGADTPFIAPREFRDILPRVFPYDFVHAIEVLGDYGGIVVHKGLLHELPLPVLESVKNEWKCAFANGVFLFYVPATSPLPAADELHQVIFHENLKSLKKLAEVDVSQIKELTALLVVASHGPDELKKTLDSVALLHAPVLVVSISPDTTVTKEYETICREHNAQLLVLDRTATPRDALKAGVRHWLKNGDITWICSFEDTMIVRSDFLLLMEQLRSGVAHRVLGGHWTEDDGVRTTFTRDGVTCVVPHRRNSLHCYAHKNYWRQKFFPTFRIGKEFYRDWKAFFFSPKIQTIVIPGLVTSQTTP